MRIFLYGIMNNIKILEVVYLSLDTMIQIIIGRLYLMKDCVLSSGNQLHISTNSLLVKSILNILTRLLILR